MYNRSFAHIILAIILVIWVVPFVALITTSFRSEIASKTSGFWTAFTPTELGHRFRKKDQLGTESLNENNLVCKAIQEVKKRYKNKIGIMCDVALDPYTSHGHDGLIKSNTILNDETIEVLINQS
jgi:ABC-type glycerol-3-phosphate transport system permease component